MAVLYTTHYMEEAERLCDRIGIIDSGRLQAEGTRDELIRLTGGADTIRLRGSGNVAAAGEALRELPGVQHVDTDRQTITLTARDAPSLVADVVASTTSRGVALAEVEINRPDLESVFLHVTGKGLRD
jgi:ABC-2 type transport system ATP-binding protein